jgi:hypothetical protein
MYERYLREEYEAKMRTYVIYKMKYDQLSMNLNKLVKLRAKLGIIFNLIDALGRNNANAVEQR